MPSSGERGRNPTPKNISELEHREQQARMTSRKSHGNEKKDKHRKSSGQEKKPKRPTPAGAAAGVAP